MKSKKCLLHHNLIHYLCVQGPKLFLVIGPKIAKLHSFHHFVCYLLLQTKLSLRVIICFCGVENAEFHVSPRDSRTQRARQGKNESESLKGHYLTHVSPLLRVLKAFLSRTAQRAPYMSSFHLLRILVVMLMTVSWFLCAWTVGVLQNRDRNIPVFVTATTSDGQDFNLCYLDRWDYMMAVGKW